ncbi:MAG TPA: DUF4188 domain-containing protein [Vicinamibacterales bacterium]|jgi:hypothetical protein|nr:DUF4188 domain-containing protein [Vicinamibacterales bacterium]
MAVVHAERMCPQIDGDFVVFLIGIRINKPWKIHKWLPVFRAMPRMLKELESQPDSGFLGAESYGFMLVQYWRSFEQLERYSRRPDAQHWPAWVAFNKRMGRSRGDVGIWHETYRISAGQYEAIYSGMPARGLGRVGRLVPARERFESARGRLGAGGPAASSGQPAGSA